MPRWAPSRLAGVFLAHVTIALAACGDDAAETRERDDGSCSGCGDGTGSQAVIDACQPVSEKLSELATTCGDYPASGFQAPCVNKGAAAEEAGCLDAFRAEQQCLEERLAEDSCACGASGFSCPNAPCSSEEDAREACVDGG